MNVQHTVCRVNAYIKQHFFSYLRQSCSRGNVPAGEFNMLPMFAALQVVMTSTCSCQPCMHLVNITGFLCMLNFREGNDSSHDRVVEGNDWSHDGAQSNLKSYTWNDTLRGCVSSEKTPSGQYKLKWTLTQRRIALTFSTLTLKLSFTWARQRRRVFQRLNDFTKTFFSIFFST